MLGGEEVLGVFLKRSMAVQDRYVKKSKGVSRLTGSEN